MIITIKGADFSTNKIGTLSTWTIFTTLGQGATYSGNRFVDKDSSLSATITIADGYELGSAGVSVIMGTTDITSSAATVSGNTITISIATVTGNVTINVPTLITGGEIPNYTFTINPTPSNATVTLTASGYTQNGNSITVPNGTTVSWKVSADGYTEQTGSWTANGGNKTENVTLIISGGGETAEWEIYSQDGLATFDIDENGNLTVEAQNVNNATVLMKNTNSNFSFKSPAESVSDGSKMVIIGRYDNNVLAFRPRGSATGTMLQRYDYTLFNGGALKTDVSAVDTFAEGDTLKVIWSGNTASLYVNDALQSSFDCSSYVANETWQKCAGFAFTNFTNMSAVVTLSDFTLE